MKYGYYYAGEYEKKLSKYIIKTNMDRFEELKKILDENRVKLNVFDYEDFCTVNFTIYDNHKNFEELYNQLNDLSKRYKDFMLGDKFAVFTKKELLEAKYLQMWVKKQIINAKDEPEVYERSCRYNRIPNRPEAGWYGYKHYYQIKPYILKYEPKINTRTAIYSIDTGFHAVFADKRIKELVENNDLKGFVFDAVYIKKETVKSENIFQLKTKNIIEVDDFVFGEEMEEDICPICGRIDYLYDDPHAYQFHIKLKKLEGNDDIYMSKRIFQDDAYSIYIISQRFYRLLKENKLDGWLDFLPIIDESE